MSEAPPPLRIRAQPSPRDPDTLRFLLDAPVQQGAGPAVYEQAEAGAPLARALFDVAGVRRIEVDGACIHVHKTVDARWPDLKPPIAAAIRAVLAGGELPLGAPDTEVGAPGADGQMLRSVRDLLDRQINPQIASHGGHITAESVQDATLYLRMSGGCQGCAASQLTLRGNVERTLRAALPDLRGVVDVTDHDAGRKPFYSNLSGAVSATDPLVPAALRADEPRR